MYACSNCGRNIGAFDEKNPPVCPYGKDKVIAAPTVLRAGEDRGGDG